MYTTVNRYLAHVHSMQYAVPHDVNNERTRRHLMEYRKADDWRDVRDEVLTPDLEYLVDVLDRADFVVAKIDDVFDYANAEFIAEEAAIQECNVCVVTKHAGYVPSPALRDDAFRRLQDVCREKLLDRFVAKLSRDQKYLLDIRRAYKERLGGNVLATMPEYPAILRRLPIKRTYEPADFDAAVERYVVETNAAPKGATE